MMHVTILKTTHTTEAEAKKLLPYIKSADVFSIEDALATEEHATWQDNDWDDLLKFSRSAFLRKTKEANQSLDLQVADYNLTMSDYLFRNQVPCWHVERFSKEKASQLERDFNKRRAAIDTALAYLNHRTIEIYHQKMWEAVSLMNNISDARDLEIARNIETAEEKLREKYPHLRQKPEIRFVLHTGGLHFPEKHTQYKTTVVNLLRTPPEVSDELETAMHSAKTLEEAKPKILHYGCMFRIAKTQPHLERRSDYRQVLEQEVSKILAHSS